MADLTLLPDQINEAIVAAAGDAEAMAALRIALLVGLGSLIAVEAGDDLRRAASLSERMGAQVLEQAARAGTVLSAGGRC